MSFQFQHYGTPKPEETRTVPLDMSSGDQAVNPSAAGKVMTAVTVQKPATMIPANIKKDIVIGGVTGTLEGGGGTQPTLFAPVVMGGTNVISWAENTRNGGYDVTTVATVNGVTAASPLEITEEMDGQTLTITSSAENFQSATTTITLAYIAAGSSVIAAFPALEPGQTIRLGFAQYNSSTAFKFDDEYAPLNGTSIFDTTKPYNYEFTQSTFAFNTAILQAASSIDRLVFDNQRTGIFDANGNRVYYLKFTGTLTVQDVNTGDTIITSNYSDNYFGSVGYRALQEHNTHFIQIIMNGTITTAVN